jgi:hypothetical protein
VKNWTSSDPSKVSVVTTLVPPTVILVVSGRSSEGAFELGRIAAPPIPADPANPVASVPRTNRTSTILLMLSLLLLRRAASAGAFQDDEPDAERRC